MKKSKKINLQEEIYFAQEEKNRFNSDDNIDFSF
jgi:hypothetical protein